MDRKQFQSILKGKILLADFSASWCAPCNAMEPVIELMINKYKDKVTIMKIDIDTQQNLATDFMVQSIPTMIIFKNGQEIRRLVGLQTETILEQSLNEALEMD